MNILKIHREIEPKMGKGRENWRNGEKRTHYIYCVHFVAALCLRAFLVSSCYDSRVIK